MTRRTILAAVLAAVMLVALAGGLAFDTVRIVAVTGQQASDQRRTLAALCTFRSDLESRVQSGIAFLKTHPKGIPGIPATTLRTSIENEQRTIVALRPLPCPKRSS